MVVVVVVVVVVVLLLFKHTSYYTISYYIIIYKYIHVVSNEEVLKTIGIESLTLLQNIKKLKLGYFGHTTQHESLEKHILEAKVEGKRRKGRPTRRWEKDIQDWLGMTTTQASRLAGDCLMFCKTVWEAMSYKGSAD